jgi:CheY-like chemotaxis protein
MTAHVLIVDDSRDILLFLRTALTRAGYRVSEATHGEEALARLAEDAPDLVISDIMMPEMDGFELLARIRADRRFVVLPVIFLTAAGNADIEERARSLGVEHFLDKPVSTRRLIATVQGTLDRFTQLRNAGMLRAATAAPVAWDAVPSGIDPLDDLTGGLPRGRTYYLTGDVGAGKTPFVVQYMHWALARGEGAVLVTTDRPSVLLQMARGLGFPLDPFIEQERLALLELAASVDQLLEQPSDLRLMVRDLLDHASAVNASRIAIASALTVLGGSPGLELTASLVTTFLRELEDSTLTTLLVGEPPATPAEQLAEAFLRRSTFGSIQLTRHPDRDDVRILTVERMLGASVNQGDCLFRVETGVGFVGVDDVPTEDGAPAPLSARLGDTLARAKQDQRTALVADGTGTFHLHERWSTAVRDCVRTIVDTRERCAVLVARVNGANGIGTDTLRNSILAAVGPDYVAHWTDARELVVLGIGADRSAMEALAADVLAQATSVSVGGDGVQVQAAIAGFTDRATTQSIQQALRRLAPRAAGRQP